MTTPCWCVNVLELEDLSERCSADWRFHSVEFVVFENHLREAVKVLGRYGKSAILVHENVSLNQVVMRVKLSGYLYADGIRLASCVDEGAVIYFQRYVPPTGKDTCGTIGYHGHVV